MLDTQAFIIVDEPIKLIDVTQHIEYALQTGLGNLSRFIVVHRQQVAFRGDKQPEIRHARRKRRERLVNIVLMLGSA